MPFAVELLPGFEVDGTWNVPTTLIFEVDGTWNVPTTLIFEVDGTWNVPTYYFDFGWLCQYRLFFSPKRYGSPFQVPLNRKNQVSSRACLVA